MFGFLKNLFGTKPVETVAEVPYKVEAVVATVTPVAEQAVEAVVTSIAPAKKPAAKKTVAKKTPAVKKPRAPKAAK